MRLVRNMFLEIAISSFFLVLLDALLTAILNFGAFFAFLSFFKIDVLYAFVPAALLFIISLIKKMRINKILELEKKYPSLNEKLRTSRDYKDAENPVLLSLHTEVINLIHDTNLNSLLNTRKIFYKIFTIIAIFSLILFSSSMGLNYKVVTDTVIRSDGYGKISAGIHEFIQNKPELKLSNNYLKEGSAAELGDNNLTLSMEVFNSELDTSQIDDPEYKEFQEDFPDEVGGMGQEIYDANIPEDYKDVIKNYFEKLDR